MEAAKLGQVVGASVRALRRARKWSQEDTARTLSQIGLRWERWRVAELESGRRHDVTLSELMFLAEAFNVRIADLVAAHPAAGLETVSAGETTRPRDHVRRLLLGELPLEPELYGPEWHSEERALPAPPYWSMSGTRIVQFYSSLEVRSALQLGVLVRDVAAAARDRWGVAIDEEVRRRLEGQNMRVAPDIEEQVIDELGASDELAEQLGRRPRR